MGHRLVCAKPKLIRMGVLYKEQEAKILASKIIYLEQTLLIRMDGWMDE